MRRSAKKARWVLATTVSLAVVGVWYLLQAPSNERVWNPDQAVLPHADIEGDLITIHNIRNFEYRTPDDYTPAYYDRTYDLRKLKRVYFIVEPFSGEKVGAHTMLSFEFEGDQFLAVSVEARREEGVAYSALKGAFRHYEIMYVLADERDIIRLRANQRGNNVYLYPAKAEPEQVKSMFTSVIDEVNRLQDQPAFYNTFVNNCTTSLVKHVNKIAENPIRWNLALLLTEKSDALAYRLGLLDVEPDDDFEAIRARHHINEWALLHDADPAFSRKIRKR